MGSSTTFVALLAVLLAWSSLGHGTPIPSSTLTPTALTSSDAPTTAKQEGTTTPTESADEQQRQVEGALETQQVPEEAPEIPQPPQETSQGSNDSPIEEPVEGLIAPEEPFREQFPSDLMMDPGFVVRSNPDGQSDATEEEMVNLEQVNQQEQEPVMQPEQEPESQDQQEPIMQREQEPESQDQQEPIMQREQEPESQDEQEFPEQIMIRQSMPSREPEEQSEVGQEPESQDQQELPEQIMVRQPIANREPEDQSEDGQEEMVDFIQDDEDSRIIQPDFRKPNFPEEQFGNPRFQSFPAEDSPHFNEVEGMYSNQQEGFLSPIIPMRQIPMTEFRPMQQME